MKGWKPFDAMKYRPMRAAELCAWRRELSAHSRDELRSLLDHEHQHLGWAVIRYASCLLALIAVVGEFAWHVVLLDSAVDGRFTPAWISATALLLSFWCCLRAAIASRYRSCALLESLQHAEGRTNAAETRRQ